MGAINRVFDAHAVPFDAWIETGTLHGEGADWLAQTLPGVPGLTIDCRDWGYHAPAHVRCLFGDSAVVMQAALAGVTGRVAVWLDAHLPTWYGGTPPGMSRLPMAAELHDLWEWSRVPGNVPYIWADDMRLYARPCASGPLWPDYGPTAPLPDLGHWDATHTIEFSPADEGYLMIRPRP